MTIVKYWGFLHLAVGCLAVFITAAIQTRDWRHTENRVFAILYHSGADIAILAKDPTETRATDRPLIKCTAVVWLVVHTVTLLLLLCLTSLGYQMDHVEDTRLVTMGLFYPLTGAVLAMGPLHYTLLHWQVGSN